VPSTPVDAPPPSSASNLTQRFAGALAAGFKSLSIRAE
jgi:hypothetical protein